MHIQESQSYKKGERRSVEYATVEDEVKAE
jgi:hypothetical protein